MLKGIHDIENNKPNYCSNCGFRITKTDRGLVIEW